MLPKPSRISSITLLLWLAVSLFAGSPALAQTAANADALPLDPELTKGRLDNGMTYLIRTHRKPENRATLWLAVNAGSMQEDDDQLGLAHFLEHMAFNGTKRFKKQEIVDYLEGIGMRFGPDLNAYTSFDETVYMLEVPSDDPQILEKALLILHEWAQGVSMEQEEVEKERGVVLEERRQGLGARARIRDKQLPVILHGSRYADRLPIGTEAVLKSAPPETMRRFYVDWYRPDLMAIIAVGDFDKTKIEAQIKERFSDLKGPAAPPKRLLHPVPGHEETLVTIATDPELPVTAVSILKKLPKMPQGTATAYREYLLHQLYHSMLNARLDELRQKADAPFRFAASQSDYSSVRTASLLTRIVMVKQNQVDRGVKALVTEVERVAQNGFLDSELERAKKELLRAYQSSSAEKEKKPSRVYASEMLRHFLQGESVPGIDYELQLLERFLPNISTGDLNTLAQQWNQKGSQVITVSAPEGSKVPSKQEVLALVDQSQIQEISAYVDSTRTEPLIPTPPSPGKIVKETTIPEIGVTQWELSNGAKVLLKPTDFKNDEILLSGFSPGGHSLVPDEDLWSAQFADTVVGAGGIGQFSAIELRKALAGKLASVSVSISELEETVRGSASPEDIEAMFQLLYLRFTSPRKDPDAFASWKANIQEWVLNRLKTPETVFRDKLQKVLTLEHPRRLPPTRENLGKVDLDKALEIYRNRFRDASDFTFVLVGNLDLQHIKPFVLKYLAGLPGSDRQEKWRDLGVKRPSGITKFEVKKGLEPKSQVYIRFMGDGEWTRQNQHDLASLSRVLGIRLREVLREDMGGTYGVRAGGGLSRRPRETYSFTLSFGCAPENVDTLTSAVLSEIETIKKEGIGEDYLVKVRESQTRKRELDVKSNRFWSGQLASYSRYDGDPRLILDYDALVKSVSSSRIQEAAKRYLKTDRYVIGVLYPEKVSEDGQHKDDVRRLADVPTFRQGRSPVKNPFPGLGWGTSHRNNCGSRTPLANLRHPGPRGCGRGEASA